MLVVKRRHTVSSDDAVQFCLDPLEKLGETDCSNCRNIRTVRCPWLSTKRTKRPFESWERLRTPISILSAEAANGERTYGINARAEWRGQCVSNVNVGHPMIACMRQTVGCHAILRDPGFASLFNVVEIAHVCFPVFVPNLLENFKCRAEPL